jgi:hypothetical protein
MSPKLFRILDRIGTMLQVVRSANGYRTDIGQYVALDSRAPHVDDLPLVACFLGTRERVAAKGAPDERVSPRGGSALCQQQLIVVGYDRVQAHAASEQIGIDIISDIQRALEQYDDTLGRLLIRNQGGLAWLSDEIFLPDIGENVVAGRVVYAIPHHRKSGDPEYA